MAFKASFKFSDSREFDVLNWRVKFNRDVDPKGRPASDIYGGTIYVEVESYNPQNEMFRLLGTKRSFSQNETFFFSHPYPALFRLISHF